MNVEEENIQLSICAIHVLECQIAQKTTTNQEKGVNTVYVVIDTSEEKRAKELLQHLLQKIFFYNTIKLLHTVV